MSFETNEMYPAGTFKLGDKIYSYRLRQIPVNKFVHCTACKGLGRIALADDKTYTCPACKGMKTTVTFTKEAVVDDEGTINSVITLTQKSHGGKEIEVFERYATGKSSLGLQIIKSNDIIFSTDRKDLEKKAKRYNESHRIEE